VGRRLAVFDSFEGCFWLHHNHGLLRQFKVPSADNDILFLLDNIYKFYVHWVGVHACLGLMAVPPFTAWENCPCGGNSGP
jgi:hypothetical protein